MHKDKIIMNWPPFMNKVYVVEDSNHLTTTPCVCVLDLHNVLADLNIHTQNMITIGANYHVLICHNNK